VLETIHATHAILHEAIADTGTEMNNPDCLSDADRILLEMMADKRAKTITRPTAYDDLRARGYVHHVRRESVGVYLELPEKGKETIK